MEAVVMISFTNGNANGMQIGESVLLLEMDDWWQKKTGKRILGPAKPIAQPAEPPQVFISYQWGKQKEVGILCETRMKPCHKKLLPIL